MDSKDTEYQVFLTELRQLSFCQVGKVLKRREDLVALTAKGGVRITRENPSFGAVFDSLKAEWEKEQAKLEYRYFCGFADDVFFRKSAQSDRRIRFLPIICDREFLRGVPELGDYLMGETEESPAGGRRFICWTRLHRQDYRFIQLILGQAYFSAEKLEEKLTVDYRGCIDRQLFLLAKALHFRDIAFFLDLDRRGERVGSGRYVDSVRMWLGRYVAPLLPDFWEQFSAEVRDHGKNICLG